MSCDRAGMKDKILYVEKVGEKQEAILARAGLTLDIGIGRRLRPLGPIALDIAAPPEVVFDVIAAPYLGPTPRALRSTLEVIAPGAGRARAVGTGGSGAAAEIKWRFVEAWPAAVADGV